MGYTNFQSNNSIAEFDSLFGYTKYYKTHKNWSYLHNQDVEFDMYCNSILCLVSIASFIAGIVFIVDAILSIMNKGLNVGAFMLSIGLVCIYMTYLCCKEAYFTYKYLQYVKMAKLSIKRYKLYVRRKEIK